MNEVFVFFENIVGWIVFHKPSTLTYYSPKLIIYGHGMEEADRIHKYCVGCDPRCIMAAARLTETGKPNNEGIS